MPISITIDHTDVSSDGEPTPTSTDSKLSMMEEPEPSPPQAAYASAFTSDIFEIIAGSSGKRFFVHLALLARSEPLRRLVVDYWTESREKKILWDVWEEDTVARFVEWLYTGDYAPVRAETNNAGESVNVAQETSAQEKILQEIEDYYQERTHKSRAFDPPAAHTDELDPLLPLLKLDIEPDRETIGESPEQDLSGTFLIHAKVAVLADYAGVPELRFLALKRLLYALANTKELEKGSSALQNLVALIRYVYANTQEYVPGDLLKKMVSTYASKHFLELRGTEVKELLLEGGDFVVDLMFETMRSVACLKTQFSDTKRLTEEQRFAGEEKKRRAEEEEEKRRIEEEERRRAEENDEKWCAEEKEEKRCIEEEPMCYIEECCIDKGEQKYADEEQMCANEEEKRHAEEYLYPDECGLAEEPPEDHFYPEECGPAEEPTVDGTNLKQELVSLWNRDLEEIRKSVADLQTTVKELPRKIKKSSLKK